MVGVGNEHRRQAIEGQFAVGLGIGNRRHLVLAADAFMVGMMLEGPRQADLEIVQPHIEAGVERSQGPAPPRHRRLGIADHPELLRDPA